MSYASTEFEAVINDTPRSIDIEQTVTGLILALEGQPAPLFYPQMRIQSMDMGGGSLDIVGTVGLSVIRLDDMGGSGIPGSIQAQGVSAGVRRR